MNIFNLFKKTNGEVKQMVEGRCMKCRTNKEIKDLVEITNARGLKCATGVCITCGTKMYKILGKEKTQ